MTRGTRIAAVVAASALVAAAVQLAAPDSGAAVLVLLAGGMVVGELLVLRLDDGSAVPLSYAVMLVLASAFELDEMALTVLVAQLVALVLRPADAEGEPRVVLLCSRLLTAAATFGAYRATIALLDHRETVAAVLAALGAAALAQIATELLLRAAFGYRHTVSVRARLAWLAVASSGMLMAIGYRGVDDVGDVGISGALLFATPLLAAWYAFERLDAATRAYRQTIESLAMAPEFGGLVPPGHAQRVRALALSIAERLGLRTDETEDLEMAALLHHLGEVTMEDPELAGRPEPGDVASITGAMMREIRPLALAGDIVSGDADESRQRLASQILRISSAYDDLTVGGGYGNDMALETLRAEPGYVYDAQIVHALERVVRDLERAS